MKATSTGRAPCWQPHKVSFSLCKYQLDTKILKIAQNCGFECCLWISYLAAQHILQFSHFCCGFCLCLCLWQLCSIVSSSVMLPWAIKIKKIYIHFCNGLLFLGNLDPLSLTPGGRIVPLVCCFRRGDNLLAWRVSEVVGYIDWSDFHQILLKHSRNNDKWKCVKKCWYLKYLSK